MHVVYTSSHLVFFKNFNNIYITFEFLFSPFFSTTKYMKSLALTSAIAVIFPSIVWATFLWPVPQSFKEGRVELNLDVCTHTFLGIFLQ